MMAVPSYDFLVNICLPVLTLICLACGFWFRSLGRRWLKELNAEAYHRGGDQLGVYMEGCGQILIVLGFIMVLGWMIASLLK